MKVTVIGHINSRVDSRKRPTDIIQGNSILKVIGWIRATSKEVPPNSIKNCLEKCGLPTTDYAAPLADFDEESQMLFSKIPVNGSVDERVDAKKHRERRCK